jgi:type IV pilus assembly protein PilO
MALLDSLANIPRRQKIVAGAIGVGIVLVLGYFLVISPKLDERASLRQKNEALQLEVNKATADAANLRPFRMQAEALRKRLQAAKERLPSEKEMPRLYRHLTDLALESGLQVAVFAPKALTDQEDVAEVPITMACEGGYHQVGAFLSRVSRLPRIVDLGDFRISGIERPTGTVRADLTLETFVFRAEGAPPPAKPSAPGRAPAAAPAPKAGKAGQ